MSVEEIKNCTMENAWELVDFAEAEGIQIQGQDVADLYDHIYHLKTRTKTVHYYPQHQPQTVNKYLLKFILTFNI